MSDGRKPIDCADVTASIEDYLEDRLGPGDREAIRRHVVSCPSCFERVIARDPIQLFAPLADESPEESRPGAWDGFWAGIRDGIDRGAKRRGRWLRAAAVVLAAAGTVAIMTLLPDPPERGRGVAPSVTPGGMAGAEPLPPTVERVVSPDSGDVQIYSMTYYGVPAGGDEAAEATELILIVDAGLDL